VSGVTRIFGVPGGGPNLDMIGTAAEVGIEFVLAHGETAACIMAATYGHLTGTPGVAIVTRGPGFTSATNGLAQATLDRYPLLLISDCVGAATAEHVMHQRLDQVAVARPVTKWSGALGTHEPEAVVRAAARLALTGPAGAVHLAFDPTVSGDAPPHVPAPDVSAESAYVEARAVLADARRPVVIVGLDAVGRASEVRAALQGIDAPILVTYAAKGVIPESWSTYAGLFTGVAPDRPLLEQADVVLGIGLDPVEPLPGRLPTHARVVLLHGHDIETPYFGTPLLLIGDYARHLGPLVDACRSEWATGTGSQRRQDILERLDAPSAGLRPQDVVLVTQEVLGDALVTVDAGAHMLPVLPLWRSDEPDAVLISNGLSTMGFALPAAIGAAFAHPGRHVVCFVGDGGLGLTLAELEVLARLRLPITVIVFNDATLSLIKLKQDQEHGGSRAVSYAGIDFATIASGMGLLGTVVNDRETLRAAVSASGERPRLIDARIEADCYRHIIKVLRG
jgi:acetolactate synthase-1/2/3 large subunit